MHRWIHPQEGDEDSGFEPRPNLDLSRADLRGADLRGACQFDEATLDEANLDEARVCARYRLQIVNYLGNPVFVDDQGAEKYLTHRLAAVSAAYGDGSSALWRGRGGRHQIGCAIDRRTGSWKTQTP